MKILIVASAFPPNIFGGGEVAAYNMACLLVRRGHEVSVATIREPQESPAWGEKQPEGFRLYRMDIPRRYSLFSRTRETSVLRKVLWHFQDYADWRNVGLMKRLLDAAQPEQVDLHNVVGFGFNALAELGKRRIPTKLFLHGLDLACFRASMFRNGSNCAVPCAGCRPVGALRQKYVAKAGRIAFVAPSQAPIDRLTPFVPLLSDRPKAVIKNVPDVLPPLPEWVPSEKVRMVFAGRLDPVKGVEFLLDVLDGLASRFSFQLDVLGEGPLERVLRERHEGKPWVAFHGFVPRAEVARAIARSDLFCMPSLWSEIYGLGTAQALQIGTPVIGSKIGGTSHLVRDGVTGVLVAPGDKRAWTDALIELLSQPEKRALLRSNAAQFRSEFSDEAIAEPYEAFSASLS